MFDVSVLLYGDHAPLAERCLGSLLQTWSPLITRIRIGMNAVSPQTSALVAWFLSVLPTPTAATLYPALDVNPGKYPTMRTMLHDPKSPVSSPRVMWFDDDSFVKDKHAGWWQQVADACEDCDLLGSVYHIRQRGQQYQGIRSQPWYTGKAVGPRHEFRFVTGGWWVIDSAILRRWDYPFSVLQHNGGDSILGELCRQQGYRIKNFKRGVAINADAEGRESKAPRRGMTTPWPWE